MHLTRYTDYALRTLIYLALKGGEPATIQEVAQRYGISQNHLMKVVHKLGTLGYVRTVRGKGGGVSLAQRPPEINVGRVVRDTEPYFAMAECFEPDGRCVIAPVCRLAGALQEALDAFLAVLDRFTLADLVHNPHALGSLLAVPAPPAAAGD